MTDLLGPVEKRDDAWLEVPSLLGDGSGYMPGPVELRSGSDDGFVRIVFERGTPGREVNIERLRHALDRLENEGGA